MEKLKVFVLGPARSGTSITFTCLRRVFRLQGRGESHVMPAFQAMLDAFDGYKARKRPAGRIAFLEVDPAKVHRHLHAFVRDFYANLYPRGGWVDKTPGPAAIRGIPLIREIFPDARIIITRRGGIETVNSFAKKFDMKVAAASKIWASCMDAILWAEEHAKDVLVIEQYDISNAPGLVAARMAGYLGQPDTAGAIERFFLENERQKSSTHDPAKRLVLGDVSWSSADRDTFIRVAGEMMQRAGYPM